MRFPNPLGGCPPECPAAATAGEAHSARGRPANVVGPYRMKVPPKNQRWPSRRGDALDDVFPPDHVRACAERSLANLGLPRIDLLQFHVWEDAWADDPRWQRAVDDLKRQGLVGAVGVSVNRW